MPQLLVISEYVIEVELHHVNMVHTYNPQKCFLLVFYTYSHRQRRIYQLCMCTNA